MRRGFLILLAWLVAVAVPLSLDPAASGAPGAPLAGPITAEPRPQQAGDVVPGSYVVIFRHDAANARGMRSLSRDMGITIDHQYSNVVRGFSAELTPEQVQALRQDPTVQFVEPNVIFEAHASLPTGADRIGADTTTNGARPPRAGSPVAVLDSGVAVHPDLNLVGGHNCTSSSPDFADYFGHGTHVAGTIGGRGSVPGVAPNTPIYAVKVLGNNGSGDLADVVCGLEWVADHHVEYGIVVANLSLGGSADPLDPETCAAPALHQAICALDAAGVTVVASAGNNDVDARSTTPALYDEVVTVAALTDTDGCWGGQGPTSSWGPNDRDDRKWIWSNHGPAVDVVAPGVDILSTVPGGYAVLSGTSMAAPHVTGSIALGWDPDSGPTQAGIPGFLPDQGLVLLSSNIACRTPASIKVSRQTVKAGAKLTIKLRHFAPGERVRVLIGGRRLAVFVVNGSGAANKRVTVPGGLKPHAYRIRAKGNAGGSASVNLKITKAKKAKAKKAKAKQAKLPKRSQEGRNS